VSDAVEIQFRADLADLEAGVGDAVALLDRAASAMADAFAPHGDARTGDEARRIATETLRIDEQTSLKEIAIAADRNDALGRLGEESLEQWKAEALVEENAKYAAELSFLAKKTAADKGDAAAEARDLAERALLWQDHVLALQKIDERTAQDKRAREREALQDGIAADNARLASALRTLDADFRAHRIGADERYRLERQLTEGIYGEELKRLDALVATLANGTKAYGDAIREREKVELAFARQSEANTDRLEVEEARKWNALGNSIKSSFNSALDGALFEGKSFGQFMLQVAEGIAKAFLQMGETIAENWIETQLANVATTKATQSASALGQISDAAGVAGANAFAATAAIPVIGPELAPAAAAAAVSETLSFSSLLTLATGAWELKSDALALLHRGEMVVPENFAQGFRAGLPAFAGTGGGDVHMQYAPTIHAREPSSLKQMLVTESSEMLAWLQRQFRNGALRV
jgi:hypothetical protein